jgi:tetratricopeptide (TPR) repeat protein
MRRATMLAVLFLLSCATDKTPAREWAAPEVVLDALPQGARVTENGFERGRTPLVLRPGGGRRTFTLSSEGFLSQEFSIGDEQIAEQNGAQILLPLRPGTWDPNGKLIDAGDGAALVRAGLELGRTGRCPEALQYLKRALQVDGTLAVAHKGMGNCYAKMKKRREAVEAYKRYLLAAPEAPDAAKVQEVISRAEGDIDAMPVRE